MPHVRTLRPQGASPIMRQLGLAGLDMLYVSMHRVTQHRGVEWNYVTLAANEVGSDE